MAIEVKAIDIISKTIEDKGMTLTYISKKIGINVNALSRCVNHKRVLKGDELILLADFLNLKISDFKKSA